MVDEKMYDQLNKLGKTEWKCFLNVARNFGGNAKAEND